MPTDKEKVQEEFQKYLLNLHGVDLQSCDHHQEANGDVNVKWGLLLTPITKSIKTEKLKASFVGFPSETFLDSTTPTWVPLPVPYPLRGHLLKIATCSNESSKKSSSTEKVKGKLEKLLKTKIMTTNENDQMTDEKEDEITIRIHQIPFLEGKYVRLPIGAGGDREFHVSIKVQPDLGPEKAIRLQLLSSDSSSLFCPFFSDWQWKVGETNALLTKMAIGGFSSEMEQEAQLFNHLLQIKEMEFRYFDQEILKDFYHHLLSQLVYFNWFSTIGTITIFEKSNFCPKIQF